MIFSQSNKCASITHLSTVNYIPRTEDRFSIICLSLSVLEAVPIMYVLHNIINVCMLHLCSYKFWTCCQRRTSDFNEFLRQEGCTSGDHLWIEVGLCFHVKYCYHKPCLFPNCFFLRTCTCKCAKWIRLHTPHPVCG